MNELTRTICIAGLIVVLGYPVLRACLRRLNDISVHRTLPRPRWRHGARSNLTLKPRKPRPYDWENER